MIRHARRAAMPLAMVAAMVVGCAPFIERDCGPLDGSACQARVAEIQAIVADDFPGRRITCIEIVNEEGHAWVRLDDGTEIGFGERLESG